MTAVAGLDWATEKHDVLICDLAGRKLAERIVTHTEAGMRELCELLIAHQVAHVAIERPDGLLIDRLSAAGIAVMAIHPNQVKAARPRFSAAGGKSDRFDAMVLCELARTDAHRFRIAKPDTDATRALRSQTRSREDLVEQKVAAANQLKAQLDAFWPAGACVFADLTSPISLAFLARHPTPADCRGLGPARMGAFLKRHSYSGRTTPQQLLARLTGPATGRTGPLETQARRQVVLALVTVLQALVTQITELTRQITQTLHDHPAAPVFRSFFTSTKTTICPATLIAEIGDSLARYPDRDALCSDAGMAPVAIESGKHQHAVFRHACDKRLRKAISVLADASRHTNPWANDVYTRARARGQDHPRAIRTLGRAWTRILWTCWTTNTPYQPAQHRALQQLLATRG
jgi:transposase